MKDSPVTIFRSARRFFSGTVLSRVSGMLRDMAMAFAFGTQDSIAAFMVAFRFSHLLRRLFGEGALQTAFIPQFEEIRADQQGRAFKFFRDLYVFLSLLLLLIIAGLMGILGMSLYFDWWTPSNGEIASLTLLMMPSLLFICLYGLNASLLQCEKHYFISSVAPVAFNLIWSIGVFAAWYLAPNQSMPWLSLFVILACLGQWLMTVPQTWRIVKAHLPNPWWKGTQILAPDLKKLAGPLVLGMIGVAASQINNALDALFARYSDLEGPAFLWYAIRIQQLPLALFGIAISSALLPPLSRAMKANDITTYQRFLNATLQQSMALMLPIAFGIFVLGDSCINLIYGRGHFGDESILGTTTCLWAYAFGLLPMGLVLIYAPAFYAQGNYRIPTIASTAAVLLNIFLNAILIMVLDFGAASVALATSVSAWLNLAILSIALRKRTGPLTSRAAKIDTIKLLAASVCASMTVIALRLFAWDDMTLWEIITQKTPHFPTSFAAQVVPLGVQGFAFGVVFAATAMAFRVNPLAPVSEGKDS